MRHGSFRLLHFESVFKSTYVEWVFSFNNLMLRANQSITNELSRKLLISKWVKSMYQGSFNLCYVIKFVLVISKNAFWYSFTRKMSSNISFSRVSWTCMKYSFCKCISASLFYCHSIIQKHVKAPLAITGHLQDALFRSLENKVVETYFLGHH